MEFGISLSRVISLSIFAVESRAATCGLCFGRQLLRHLRTVDLFSTRAACASSFFFRNSAPKLGLRKEDLLVNGVRLWTDQHACSGTFHSSVLKFDWYSCCQETKRFRRATEDIFSSSGQRRSRRLPSPFLSGRHSMVEHDARELSNLFLLCQEAFELRSSYIKHEREAGKSVLSLARLTLAVDKTIRSRRQPTDFSPGRLHEHAAFLNCMCCFRHSFSIPHEQLPKSLKPITRHEYIMSLSLEHMPWPEAVQW